MTSEKFLESIIGKIVHVDFFDEKQGQMGWIEGTFSEHVWDNEEEDPEKEFVVIVTETDMNRIPMRDVRKIYLKKEKYP